MGKGVGHHVRRAAFLEGGSKDKHAVNEDEEAQVDGGVALLGFHASGKVEDGDSNDGRSRDGHNVEGRSQDDPGHDGIYDGELLAETLGGGRRAVDQEDIRTGPEVFDGVLGAEKEQGITGTQEELVEVLPDVASLAVDGHDGGPEALAEIHFLEGTAKDGGVWRDNGFDQSPLFGMDLLNAPLFRFASKVHPFDPPGFGDTGRTALEDEAVPCLKGGFGGVDIKGYVMADNFEQPDPPFPCQAGFLHGFTDDLSVSPHEGFGNELFAFFFREHGGKGFAKWEDPFSKKDKVEDSDPEQRQANLPELEHAKGLLAKLNDDAAGEDIRAGAKEGASSPKDRGVGKRNEELGGGLVDFLGQRDDDWEQDDDDGRIIYKPGDRRDR